MKRKSSSQAKNAIKRAFADLIDPPPSEVTQRALRAHFADRCAYCGAEAKPRDGHVDHADPARGSGIANLVLACKRCNGDSKRQMGWEEFLALQCGTDAVLLAERRSLILAWFGAGHPPPVEVPHELRALCNAALAEALAAFELAYGRVRDARSPTRPRAGATSDD